MDPLLVTMSASLSLLAGLSFLEYLTVHPLRMSPYLALTCFLVSSISFVIGYACFIDPESATATAGVAPLFFLVGYSVMTSRVLSAREKRVMPQLRRHKGDPGLGHTAIIYFTHGEPETYTPQSWINQFREFDEQGIRFVPWLARPLFLYNLRSRYLRVGRSNHKLMHMLRLRDLEQAYRKMGDYTTRFYISFLDDDPRPDAAVLQTLNDGASRIILSEVFVTVSNHTREGEKLVEELHVSDYEVDLFYTGPLWDSETLQRMFVNRANAVIGDTPKDRVAVLLVGHGQPDEWDKEWPTETQQEEEFRKRIFEQFIRDGYSPSNLSAAWMEFKEPRPASTIDRLVAIGATKILFYSACISADAIHSTCDVPDLIYAAKIPKDVELLNMGAWDNNPLTVQAIKEKIDKANTRARDNRVT